jgi:hypothetical protein
MYSTVEDVVSLLVLLRMEAVPGRLPDQVVSIGVPGETRPVS